MLNRLDTISEQNGFHKRIKDIQRINKTIECTFSMMHRRKKSGRASNGETEIVNQVKQNKIMEGSILAMCALRTYIKDLRPKGKTNQLFIETLFF